MRPKVFTVNASTAVQYSPAYPIDLYPTPCNIGIGVTVSGNNTVADVQHTFGNPWSTNLNVVSAVAWINNATLVSATAANNINGTTDTNYAFPPQAIRLRVRATSSAGTGDAATITIVQAGPGGI